MNALSRLMGYVLFVLSFGMILAGVIAHSFIALICPRQPDSASGHVIPVTIVSHHGAYQNVEYLTQFEKTIFDVSYLFAGIGFIGLFGYLFAAGKLRKPTSFW